MKLTEKQKRFADYYVKTCNAEESAKKAGYSDTYARGQSYKLLANVGIKEYIERRNEKLESERIADMTEVKEFWTTLLRSEEDDMKDRLKASEFIAKTNGAFIDKVEHSGSVGINEAVKELDKYFDSDDYD